MPKCAVKKDVETPNKLVESFIEGMKSGKSPDECVTRLTAGLLGTYSILEEEWAIEILSVLKNAGQNLPFSSLLRSVSLAVDSMTNQAANVMINCKCSRCEAVLELLSDKEYINKSSLEIAESACSFLKEPNQFLAILARTLLTVSLSYDHALEMKGIKK